MSVGILCCIYEVLYRKIEFFVFNYFIMMILIMSKILHYDALLTLIQWYSG